MATPVGIIKQFVKALMETKSTGTDAVNEAFKAVGAVSYDVFQNKFKADQNGLSTQDFLEQKCGIRVNNKDTGAITGSDAGYSKTAKTAESIVPETAAAVELTDDQYNSFTKNGLTVNISYHTKSDVDAGEKFGYSGDTYLEKQKLVTRALYNWWLPESLDLINQSLGINFTDGRANVNELTIWFDNNMAHNMGEAVALSFAYDMGYASEMILRINPNFLYNITADDKNGMLDGNKCIWSNDWHYRDYSIAFTNYLDRLILQALAEVTLKANVAYAHYLPCEILDGLCEIVGGFDSPNAYGYSLGLQSYTGYYYLSNSSTEQHYGYGLMRYLAKNYSDGTPDPDDTTIGGGDEDTTPTALVTTNKTAKASITGTDYDDEVFNYAKNATIRGGDGDDLLTTMRKSSNVRLYGDAGNDTLEAYNATKVTLNGGAGNDEIYAGSSNVTIVAGAGNDTITLDDSAAMIQYKSGDGNDLIDGFNDDATLKIGNGTSDTYSTVKSGDNLIVTVGKGKLTLLGAADLTELNILGTEKNLRDVIGTTGADKIANALAGATIQALGGNDSIKNTGANVSIVAGAGNDTITNTKNNVTIDAGTGNDRISLGANAGNNLIICSGGNDSIAGYTEDDTISIASGAATAEVSGSNIILTTDNGIVTIKGAANKIITYVDERGSHTYPNQGVIIDGKTAYLTDEFTEDSFSIADSLSVETVDASVITYDIALIGNKKANLILGGIGNDTLDGGSGNDSLTGGEGSDVFYYTAGEGNDTITDYDEDYDKIVIDGEVSSVTTTAKGNAIIYVGDKRIVVEDGKGKKIRYIDNAENIKLNANGTAVTLLSNYRDYTFDVTTNDKVAAYDASIQTIDASKVPYDIAITGNSRANTIYGSANNDYIDGAAAKDVLYGGEGNDTLIGGTGNDTLWGGDGDDTFIYANGDGKDVISDFDEGDMLEITGTFSGTYNASTNAVAIKVGSTASALTLQNVTASDTFNINGDAYHISGTKLVKK